MKKLKITLTALAMLLTVMGTVAASASPHQANNCSKVQGTPFDRLSSNCDGTNVTCCYKGAIIVLGHYN